jgi:hypothetical protein
MYFGHFDAGQFSIRIILEKKKKKKKGQKAISHDSGIRMAG